MSFGPYQQFCVDTTWPPDEAARALGPHLLPGAPAARPAGPLDPRGFRVELAPAAAPAGPPGPAGVLVRGRIQAFASGSRVHVTVTPAPRRLAEAASRLAQILALAGVALGTSALAPGLFWVVVFLAFIGGPELVFDLLDRCDRLAVEPEARRLERRLRDALPAPVLARGGPFRSPGGA